ncbi:MAG: S9 family peptidase [Ktedonobacteraceae bacterium]
MSRSISIEDLYEFKFLSRPRISPDGQRVAFVVTSIEKRTYAYRSAIQVMSAEGGEAMRFTSDHANAHSPTWSPDGRWLAFVSDREGELQGNTHAEQRQRGKGKAQIWLIPTGGGEARQLTFMPHGAVHAVWSPNSRQVLFSAGVGPLDEETEDGHPLPKVRVIDRLFYRYDGTGFVYNRRQHLFLINAEGDREGTPTQLTDGDWDDKDASWSADGTKIAFTSGRTEDRWQTRCADVYTLSIEQGQPGELQRLTDGTHACNSPSWSPDGQSLAFLASAKYASAGHVELFTLSPPTKDGLLHNLTSEFEGSCSDWTNSDVTDEHLMPAPPWSPDGKTLYVLAGQRGSSRVFAIPSAGAGKQPQAVSPNNVHALDFSMDVARQKMVTLIETPTHLAEVFVSTDITGAAGATRRLTHCNDTLFDELALATPAYMPFTGEDGWSIDGWLLKPRDFDPAKKYPLIVEVHGGPHTQYGYGFMHEMQMLAAAGNVVLFTNPRGSLGYGKEFALALRGAWAEKDSLDILDGMDTAIQKGFIDEQRLGVIGGSYGGFMSSWLIGHTDRFRVAVADRSVINRLSFFGSSDIGWEYTDDELIVPPWDDPERYMYSSPITYVKNIHTPLLIIHSENDLRCNIEQSEQLFASLKYLGREVLFVRFEGQSHGLSRGGHPHSRVERLKHIQKWFADHFA